MSLGFDRPLYVLPFDHRGSFETGMFGWKGALTNEQTSQLGEAKRIIYDGCDFPLEVPRHFVIAWMIHIDPVMDSLRKTLDQATLASAQTTLSDINGTLDPDSPLAIK